MIGCVTCSQITILFNKLSSLNIRSSTRFPAIARWIFSQIIIVRPCLSVIGSMSDSITPSWANLLTYAPPCAGLSLQIIQFARMVFANYHFSKCGWNPVQFIDAPPCAYPGRLLLQINCDMREKSQLLDNCTAMCLFAMLMCHRKSPQQSWFALCEDGSLQRPANWLWIYKLGTLPLVVIHLVLSWAYWFAMCKDGCKPMSSSVTRIPVLRDVPIFLRQWCDHWVKVNGDPWWAGQSRCRLGIPKRHRSDLLLLLSFLNHFVRSDITRE